MAGVVSIGRDPSCDLQLHDTKSSRRHARIERQGLNFVVVDEGSRNGTWVNDHPVQTAVLSHGDKIYIGDSVLEFVVPLQLHVSAGRADSISGGSTGGLTLVLKGDDAEAEEAFLSGEHLRVDEGALLAARETTNAEALRELNEKLRRVYEVNKVLSSLMPVTELLERVLQIMFEFLPAERGLILLQEPDQGFVPVAGRTKEGATSTEIPVSSTLLRKAVAERMALLSGDVARDSRFDPSESIVVQGITSCLTVPMVHRERVVGIVYLDTMGSYAAFSKDDLEIVTAIASQAAIAVENARLLAKVERDAVIRDNLSRYLSAELVEQVMGGGTNVSMEGSLKVATILFADIRGFTALSERIAPQLVVRLLNDYFEIMVDIVHECGGVVDKFVGDELMAVWGVPEPRPDDALRAVEAGVRMQRALCTYNERRSSMGEEPIYMGVGINTGTVVAGNIGSSKRMQYTVIGDAVNLASRLQGLTDREQVVVSEGTHELVKDSVKSVARGLHKIKGRQAEVAVFEIRGLVEAASAAPGRRHDRIKTAIPVRCIRLASNKIFSAVLRDISPGGAGLQADEASVADLASGEKVVLGFVTPTRKILLRGGVVRIADMADRQQGLKLVGLVFVEEADVVGAVIDEIVLLGRADPDEPAGT